ncbi:MAG: cell division protein [Gemmatimonadales bacterium]|nr:MAG: cell division protein [Gemmatimonadales bacterium]
MRYKAELGWPALALLLGSSCARPLPPGRVAEEPELRVGLVVGVPRVVVGGQDRVAAVSEGTPVFTVPRGQTVTVTPDGRGIALNHGGSGGRYESLTFVSLSPGRYVTVEGKPYRGVVEVWNGGGGVTAVNRVRLEDYLLGVVSRELGPRSSGEAAALRAQAVVSRTYALRNRGRSASQGFDLRATVADQAYGGVEAETPEGTAAVHATAGEVLTYGGEPILALFHSTCGYATAVPREVFRTIENHPYLRSVSDRKGAGYYCDISPRFRWRVEWDGDDLIRILRRTVPEVLGIESELVDRIRDLRVVRTGPSGRVTELRIAVGKGEIPVFGPDLRSVLLSPDGSGLLSSAVQFEVQRSGDRVVKVIAAGAGSGHGVGMCQWGAVGRARAGQSYREILAHYYPGAKLERWY